jgi:hypothetical protein
MSYVLFWYKILVTARTWRDKILYSIIFYISIYIFRLYLKLIQFQQKYDKQFLSCSTPVTLRN